MSAEAAAKLTRTGPKRCAIYIRVSTAMQRMEGWSLDAQRDSLTRYAERAGWKIVGVYADEGKSARKRLKDRKAIGQLLDDVRAHKLDVILFKELDRWFRNMSDFYKVQEVLDANDVTWVSERQPNLDMTTKEGRLAANIMLSVGQNEADACSDRIKYTNKFMREQHRWTGGNQTLPRGYMVDENQHVVIDPEQEPYVRDLIAAFMQTNSVRRALINTNAAYNTHLIYNNGLGLLRNEMLCGRYKGIEDYIETPYLTPEEFDRMQGLIRKNIKSSVKHDYIFSGIITCAECGKNMAGNMAGSNAKYPSYRCSHSAYYEHRHPFNSVGERRLEANLVPYVKAAIDEQIVTVTEITETRKRAKPKSNRVQIEKKLDKLEDLYINSDRMTKDKYEEKKAAIMAQLIEAEPETEIPEVASLEAIRDLFEGDFQAIYDGMSREEKRNFWRGIINKVTVKGGQIVSVDFKA